MERIVIVDFGFDDGLCKAWGDEEPVAIQATAPAVALADLAVSRLRLRRNLGLRVGLLRRPGFEELLFAVNQGINVGRRELDIVTVRNCIRRTRFYAIAAKNTARIIDVVNFGISLAG